MSITGSRVVQVAGDGQKYSDGSRSLSLLEVGNVSTFDGYLELKYEINLELLITIVVICLLRRIWAHAQKRLQPYHHNGELLQEL
jgi:hypothetical protein